MNPAVWFGAGRHRISVFGDFPSVKELVPPAARRGEASGQGPFGDVLLRQVVGHVAAQGSHRHRCHVTGTAVCRAEEERAMTT